MYWEQGQSYVSTSAIAEVSYMGPVAYEYFDNFYVADIPYHPLYEILGERRRCGDAAGKRTGGAQKCHLTIRLGNGSDW